MDIDQFLKEAKSRLVKLSNGDYVMRAEDLQELESMLEEDNRKPAATEKFRPRTFEEVSARAKRHPALAGGTGEPDAS